MADLQMKDELSVFLETGIYKFEDSNVVFIDPVRVLNRSYTRFRVSPSAYYPRFFKSQRACQESTVSSNSRKRKRNAKEPRPLNESERVAEHRHQEAKPLLLKAHEYLLKSTELLEVLGKLSNDIGSSTQCKGLSVQGVENSLIELGRVWQAPLYEITLTLPCHKKANDNKDSLSMQYGEQMVLPAFNNVVANETEDDVEAELLNSHYILPRESCFYMSDLGKIHNLIPDEGACGFNLIVIDPPWENASAHQKSRYPTLPNRYFLSLPIKRLTHTEGALVALWVTNRQKLRVFVEEELFPTWGVSYLATFYWLKVKADGSLIGDLDLFHHRPYESLILGYRHGKVMNSDNLSTIRPVKDNCVILSIPGDYSRKPPIGGLLEEYFPGLKPGRRIELFAREMMAGWVAWGNEPLHFQDSRHFNQV
ncbi:Methyltransferase-like protein 2 [Quillaja saponaria]|uniref:Methyltransferase-like protein 2 n=1 Tax=Quillaja saponaria TaxID=32244 RepID=A0AAD7PKD6_QUISA|nr:Methyltransferase-like protein 2 [Quillaja saponaria]